MRRDDRHGRAVHADVHRSRRPVSGFRLPAPVSFDRAVTDAIAELVPPVARALLGVPVDVVEIPPVKDGDTGIRLVHLEVVERRARRLTIYRRPVELRARSRDEATTVIRDAIELEAYLVLEIDPEDRS